MQRQSPDHDTRQRNYKLTDSEGIRKEFEVEVKTILSSLI